MDEIIHIDRRRLLEIAAKELRLGRTELNHIEDCPDCRGAFAKVILEVTRGRAQEKTRTKKKRRLVTGVHIPDGRFREIVFSLTRAGRVPAVLSAQESEHF